MSPGNKFSGNRGQGGGRGSGQGQGGGRGQGSNRGFGPGLKGGRGTGRGSHGLGPGGQCVCPKCGHLVPHQQGIPCLEQDCPECGQKMTRQ